MYKTKSYDFTKSAKENLAGLVKYMPPEGYAPVKVWEKLLLDLGGTRIVVSVKPVSWENVSVLSQASCLDMAIFEEGGMSLSTGRYVEALKPRLQYDCGAVVGSRHFVTEFVEAIAQNMAKVAALRAQLAQVEIR
jgi:hypothetical protein